MSMDFKWLHNYSIFEDYCKNNICIPKKRLLYKGLNITSWYYNQVESHKQGTLGGEKENSMFEIFPLWYVTKYLDSFLGWIHCGTMVRPMSLPLTYIHNRVQYWDSYFRKGIFSLEDYYEYCKKKKIVKGVDEVIEVMKVTHGVDLEGYEKLKMIGDISGCKFLRYKELSELIELIRPHGNINNYIDNLGKGTDIEELSIFKCYYYFNETYEGVSKIKGVPYGLVGSIVRRVKKNLSEVYKYDKSCFDSLYSNYNKYKSDFYFPNDQSEWGYRFSIDTLGMLAEKEGFVFKSNLEYLEDFKTKAKGSEMSDSELFEWFVNHVSNGMNLDLGFLHNYDLGFVENYNELKCKSV